MSIVVNNWATATDNGDTSENGRVSIIAASNYGRNARDVVSFHVRGPSGTRNIQVSQDGHEFVLYPTANPVELNDVASLFSASFFTNSKYLSVGLSTLDESHFHLYSVSYKTENSGGQFIPFSGDLTGTLEVPEDPGQTNYYTINVSIVLSQNTGQRNRMATVTLEGWSAEGGAHFSDSVLIIQKAQE